MKIAFVYKENKVDAHKKDTGNSSILKIAKKAV